MVHVTSPQTNDKPSFKRSVTLTRDNRHITSSSAVAERPRDALCLSVVSFNSTKRRAQVPLQVYLCVQFKSVLSMLVVINNITDAWQ